MSNLVSVVFFSFYCRLSSLLEILSYISKSFRNGATYARTVLYFDFILNIGRPVSFNCYYGNHWRI